MLAFSFIPKSLVEKQSLTTCSYNFQGEARLMNK